jgi:hypothetical protein
MANDEHVQMLKKGVDAWNDWRLRTSVRVDLSSANLSNRNFTKFNFSGCDLRWAGLRGAICEECNFVSADLMGANLRGARLVHAEFREGDLRWTHLMDANLQWADLRDAKLQGALLLKSNLRGADLRGSRIFGISAWGVELDNTTKQSDLIISSYTEPLITVDNIEVAQFVHLLLHSEKIRDVIDTIGKKAVLILGRFTAERKAVLDALREELRKRDYLPILFDFEKPSSRSTDETITLLARMARFVVADISDAKSVLQELRAIVPDLPSVPVQSIILAKQEEPGMFDFFRRYPWFLPVHRYETSPQLLADLDERVIAPAEAEVVRLRALALAGGGIGAASER